MPTRRLLVTFLLVLAMLLMPATALAAGEGNGTIEGRIVNGTAATTSSVAGQEINLKINLKSSEVGSDTVLTDAEGSFTFTGLSTDPGYSYSIAIFYQDAEYDSETLTFTEGETEKSIDVTVYDSTTSADFISVMMAHTIIYVGDGSLLVKEYSIFVNSSDLTYIGSKEIPGSTAREILAFDLPANATNLQPSTGFMDCCIFNSENGFIDSMPVLPGGKELAYSYQIDFDSEEYTFSRPIDYPTVNYSLLIQSGAVDIPSGQLTQEETLDMDGAQFNHFSASDLPAGEVLVARISDLPKTSNQMTIAWVTIVIVIIALGFGFTYILRKRKPQPVAVEGGQPLNQQLIAELAQLDDDFENGKIPEDVYQKQRAEKKSQLVDLLQTSKKNSGQT